MAVQELVSIVVPVYNAGKYIEETIAMVQAQDYPDWELLLVDDCSKDDSCEKIVRCIEQSPVGSKIRLIKKPVNEGAAKARNTGIHEAVGRYIAFLDADDVWKPEKLTKELGFMKEKQAAFVFTAYEFGNEKAEPTGKVVQVPETLTYKQALSRTVIFTTTVLFDTAKISKELLYMPAVKSEDTATWWKILRNGYTAYGLNEVLAIYRRPPGSLSSNKLEAIRRIWNLYRKEEKLNFFYSLYNLCFWAVRATLRRI
ncbi:MAG: glycosyltransferase family 2 protein [Lachnospiraceae bacterium]|nr:glycosyltransferase family 2 protein [Lachnospiraceae bacterium]